MEITIQELNSLEKDSYQIIDIRSDIEISHGVIPGAIHAEAADIAKDERIDIQRKSQRGCGRGALRTGL